MPFQYTFDKLRAMAFLGDISGPVEAALTQDDVEITVRMNEVLTLRSIGHAIESKKLIESATRGERVTRYTSREKNFEQADKQALLAGLDLDQVVELFDLAASIDLIDNSGDKPSYYEDITVFRTMRDQAYSKRYSFAQE